MPKRVKKYHCPVCKKVAFVEVAMYEICDNCFWEDDGTKSENELSMFSPNHKTIKQYREDFLKNKRGE